MNPFWLAWTFLTTFPGPGQGRASQSDFVRSRVWYPVVGAALGSLWWSVATGLRAAGSPAELVAAGVLATMLVSTGFLHLDGLLDSGDALLVPKPPEDRLRILKDVHLGSFAFGVGATWFLAMHASLAHLGDPRLLLALPILSRGIMLLPVQIFPYARALPDDPSSLSSGSPTIFRLWWILPAATTGVAIFFFPLEAVAILVVQLLFALWASHRLGGGITGDVYGAGLCLSECAGLALHATLS